MVENEKSSFKISIRLFFFSIELESSFSIIMKKSLFKINLFIFVRLMRSSKIDFDFWRGDTKQWHQQIMQNIMYDFPKRQSHFRLVRIFFRKITQARKQTVRRPDVARDRLFSYFLNTLYIRGVPLSHGNLNVYDVSYVNNINRIPIFYMTREAKDYDFFQLNINRLSKRLWKKYLLFYCFFKTRKQPFYEYFIFKTCTAKCNIGPTIDETEHFENQGQWYRFAYDTHEYYCYIFLTFKRFSYKLTCKFII